MVISEGGANSQAFVIGVVFDKIHIITTCDKDQRSDGTCPAIVAHADGTQVSADSPAQPGETVVVYAWGAGNTSPRVKTGVAGPVPAPVVNLPGYSGLLVGFDFAPNAGPSRPYYPTAVSVPGYLAPGFVGLYQINVQLPAQFPPVPACDDGNVFSNLTISVAGPYTFDGAAICVRVTGATQPQQGGDLAWRSMRPIAKLIGRSGR